jgi:hypothetical protein
MIPASFYKLVPPHDTHPQSLLQTRCRKSSSPWNNGSQNTDGELWLKSGLRVRTERNTPLLQEAFLQVLCHSPASLNLTKKSQIAQVNQACRPFFSTHRISPFKILKSAKVEKSRGG